MGIVKSIKSALKKTGLTQQEMADYIGCKRETVNSWCNGHTVPDHTMMCKVAALCGVKLSTMIQWGE